MAVTVTTILAGTSRFIADLESTADADVTSGNIAHGLGAAPLSLFLTALLVEFYLSEPALTTVDATNLVVTLANNVGAGVAGDQMRIECQLPHSLTR